MITKNSISIRIIKWTGFVLSILLILLLLATWFINQEPFQKKIRHDLAQRAGNSFTFRDLGLALFPRPHVTVNKGSVNVSGKFVVSMESAIIYPEILPLLTGKVRIAKIQFLTPQMNIKISEEPGAQPEDPRTVFMETQAGIESIMASIRAVAPDFVGKISRGKLTFSDSRGVLTTIDDINGSIMLLPKALDITIRADVQRWGRVTVHGALYALENSIGIKDLSIAGGRSSFSRMSARFKWKKVPYLEIESGQAFIFLEDIYERRVWFGEFLDQLREVKSMTGAVRVSDMSFIGPVLHPERWKMETTGTLEGILVYSRLYSRPVQIKQGRFRATKNTLSLTGLQGTIMDSSLAASVTLSGSIGNIRSADLSLQGTAGRDTISWASKKFNLPQKMIIRAPLSLSDLHFTWEKGSTFSIAARAAVKNGPSVTVDLRKNSEELVIKRLMIEDNGTRATLMFRKMEKFLDIAFNGSVKEDTLSRMFEYAPFHHGWIQGNFQANIRMDRPRESTANGTFEGMNLFLPPGQGPSLTIKHINLRAKDKIMDVNTASFLWGEHPLDLKGRITALAEGFLVDMDLDAESISTETIQRALATREKTGDQDKRSSRLPVQGTIRFNAKNFIYSRYTLSPFKAKIALLRDYVRVTITEAVLCGISIPGSLQPLGRELQLDLNPIANTQPLEPALQCLSSGNNRITGNFHMYGELHSRGKSGTLVRSLQGNVEFRAKHGKIYRYPVLARIFAFLSVTELLRGKLPDMGRDGFEYKTIKIKGNIRNGKLVLREASIEGPTLNIAAEGVIDFGADKIDITVLVAPFKTLDYIISKIPLLRNVLANRLFTVPVKVKGNINTPDVTPLSPEAIGENLLNIMKRTLELPFKVLDPLFEGKKDGK